MLTIVVSANEHREVKLALGKMALEDNLPYDFKLFTARGVVPRERKVFPSDFLASIYDGRMSRECAAMREDSQYPGVILEGQACYTTDGHLRNGRIVTNFTRASLRNLIRSIEYVEGCVVEWSSDIGDTVDILIETQTWFDKVNHNSLRTRQPIQTDWLRPTYQERYLYWLQGLPTISISRAKKIAEVYPSPMSLLRAIVANGEFSQKALTTVPGIGKGIAGTIAKFVSGDSK